MCIRDRPTIMDNVTFDDAVMQEEIFGPLMPIPVSYTHLPKISVN